MAIRAPFHRKYTQRRNIGPMSVNCRTAALTAGMALLLTSGCATTVKGTGTAATPLSGGPSSTEPTSAEPTGGGGLISYQGDHFTVSMPDTPTKSNETISTPSGPTDLTLLTVEKDGNTYFIAYADLPAGTQFDLNGAASGAAKSAHGRLADVKHVTYRGAPAIDFRIVGAGGSATGFERALNVDDRLYELLAVVPGKNVKTPPFEYPLMLESLMF
jgi:hypothetical protein